MQSESTCLICFIKVSMAAGLLNRKNNSQNVAGMVLPTDAQSIASWKEGVSEPLSKPLKYSVRFTMNSLLSLPRYLLTASRRI